MQQGKKIYFASDFHLGIPNKAQSLIREKLVVDWLEHIKKDAEVIYLVGDIFDFWFEYKTVIPKGYSRLFGKLAELTDAGIKMEILIGNHDMWMFGYFNEEFGIPVHKHPIEREFNSKKFYIAHGDGLGPGDSGYKFIKKVFRNPVLQWLFGWLHPNIGIGLANFWSKKSRLAQGGTVKPFHGEEHEWLVQYSKGILKKVHFDYFIYGHRHVPLDIQLPQNSRYINLGDWLKYYSYAVFDGENLSLEYYQK